MNIAVVIPCYNEEDSLESLLEDFEKYTSDLEDNYVAIIVNDCSKDSTPLIAKRLNCVLLDLPVNLGIGGAVQTGFKYGLLHDFDLVIQMDGDGQHPPSEIGKLVDAYKAGKAEVIIGSRFIENQGFQSTQIRRVGIQYFSFLIKALTGISISDPTSGFRAFGRDAMQIVCSYYPEKYPEPEIIICFYHHGLKMTEIPVVMKDRQGGKSSIHSWKSAYYMIKVTLGILFSHLRINFYGNY